MLLRFKTSQAAFVCRACVLGEGNPESLEEAAKLIKQIMLNEEKSTVIVAEDINCSIDVLLKENVDGNTETLSTTGENRVVTPENQANKNERQNSNDKKSKTICKYYLQKECRYGRVGKECNFSHPKMCVKFTNNGDKKGGCKKGQTCKDYHPKLCWNSLQRNECDRERCRYYHLNGTKVVGCHLSDQPQTVNIKTGNVNGPLNMRTQSPRGQYDIGGDRIGDERGYAGALISNIDRLSSRPAETSNNNDFLLMNQRMQRMETMITSMMQSIRPPGYWRPDHRENP